MAQDKTVQRKLQDLIIIMSDPVISDLFATYANMRYNTIVDTLKAESDLLKIGRAQGQLVAWTEISNLKDRLSDIIRG